METADLIQAYKALPTEAITIITWEAVPYADREEYVSRIISSDIRAMVPDCKMAGIAVTLKETKLCWNELEAIGPGTVLVVDARGTDKSVWGQITTCIAKLRGAEGVVIDGYTQHASRLRKIGLPVYARGVRPLFEGCQMEGNINVPIECGGVKVKPGDFVIGDEDGIIVLTRDDAERLLHGAQRISEMHHFLMQKMDEGHDYLEMPGIKDMWGTKVAPHGEEWKLYDEWLKTYGGQIG